MAQPEFPPGNVLGETNITRDVRHRLGSLRGKLHCNAYVSFQTCSVDWKARYFAQIFVHNLSHSTVLAGPDLGHSPIVCILNGLVIPFSLASVVWASL